MAGLLDFLGNATDTSAFDPAKLGLLKFLQMQQGQQPAAPGLAGQAMQPAQPGQMQAPQSAPSMSMSPLAMRPTITPPSALPASDDGEDDTASMPSAAAKPASGLLAQPTALPGATAPTPPNQPMPVAQDGAQPSGGLLSKADGFLDKLGNIYGNGGAGDSLINLGLAVGSKGNMAQNVMKAGLLNSQNQQTAQQRQLQQMQLNQKQQGLQARLQALKAAGKSEAEAMAIATSDPAFSSWSASQNKDKDPKIVSLNGGLVAVDPSNLDAGVKTLVAPPPGGQNNQAIQEYEYAKKNGFGGSYTDFLNAKAGPKVVGGNLVSATGEPLFKGSAGQMPADTADFLAERVLSGDTKALVGLGRGAQGAENLQAIQGLVAKKAQERGIDPSDILAKTAEQSGLTAQQRTFGTQTARMATASTEANGAIDLGMQASAGVPRGNWVPVNKAIQAWQSGSSDPALAKFGAANMTIINTYARAINPNGTPTISDKEHAEKLLSTAQGPEAYQAVLSQLKQEIELAHNSPEVAKKMLENIRKGRPSMDGLGGGNAAPAPGRSDYSHLWGN